VVVQVLNSENHLPDIKLRLVGLEQVHISDRVKQLHPLDVLAEEEDVVVIDVASVEFHDERMEGHRADLFLGLDIILELLFLYIILVH